MAKDRQTIAGRWRRPSPAMARSRRRRPGRRRRPRAKEGPGNGGRGKSKPIIAESDFEESGQRNVRKRGVSASVRRHKKGTPAIEGASETPVDDQIQDDRMEDDDMEDRRIDDADFETSEDESLGPIVNIRRKKGKDGRFIAETSSVTSRRARTEIPAWTVSDPVPGGPEDGSIIPSFLGHVAYGIWTGKEERGTLKCQSRHAVCKRLSAWHHDASDEVKHLIAESDDHYICYIPVDGKVVSDKPGKQLLLASCVEILGISMDDLLANSTKHYENGGVLIESIFRNCGRGLSAEVEAIAWMWLTLGCTLFVDKTGHRVKPACLWEVRDGVADAKDYSWGSATLAYLFRQLGIASRGDCHGLSGCLTLLQAWIYEYFPCFRPQRDRLITEIGTPRALSWSVSGTECTEIRLQSLRARIDSLTADEVSWLPFGGGPAAVLQRTAYMGWIAYRDIVEPYMSARFVRQLGYVQSIPSPILRPEKAVRAWNSKLYNVEMAQIGAVDGWQGFPMTCMLPLTLLEPATVLAGACHPAYLEWYARFSHPQVLSSDVTASRGRPSRSNIDYWVNRFSSLSQRNLTRITAASAPFAIPEIDQSISESTTDLERLIADWRLAD
ncbi:protein MAIN-LIKE 1-like [Mercurialis annua]|uniref:protein MAIN-LIKE 1-like n=1 Tax=Mercurialis annua TaxID=3986 RepID=UPI00215F2F87|nr:protein MAIN-LIKE 1-like [Mercurialis annua]